MKLVAWICTVCLCCVVTAERPRIIHDYMRMPENVGVGFANPALPFYALTKEDLDRWSRILVASEAQREYMLVEYERFVAHHNEFMDREIPGYLATSAQVDAASHEFDQQLADAMKELQRRSDRLCRDLERIEHDFIDSLVPVLSMEQIDRLEILRLESNRRHARTFHNAVRWADIELRRVWDDLDPDLISSEVSASADALLAEYERALTPLVRNHADAFWNRPIAIASLLGRYRDELVTDESFNVQYRRIHGRHLNAGRRIRSLTKATLEHIAEEIPAEVSDALISEVKKLVYPEIYPDPFDLQMLFDALSLEMSHSDSVRAQVASHLETYKERHATLCRRMERLCLEWSDGSARGDSDYHRAQFPNALAPLLEQREVLAISTMETLTQLLGAEIIEEHRHLIPTALSKRMETAELISE